MRDVQYNLQPGDWFWFLDVQTTGTSPNFDAITEIAWTEPRLFEDWFRNLDHLIEPTDSFEIKSSLVCPPLEFEWSRSRIKRLRELSGIERPHLELAPQLPDVWNLVIADIVSSVKSASLKKWPKCLIHYARFELSFLGRMPLFPQSEFEFLCTFEWARKVLADLPSKSLRSVAGRFGHLTGEMKRAHSHVHASISVARGLAAFSGIAGLETSYASETIQIKGQSLEFRQSIVTQVRRSLPECPGVYRFIGPQGCTLYIGKAVNLNARVNSYFRGRKSKGARLNEMMSQVKNIGFLEINCPIKVAIIENELIKAFDPPYNRALRLRERSAGWIIDCGGLLSKLEVENVSGQLNTKFDFSIGIPCSNMMSIKHAIQVLQLAWGLTDWFELPFQSHVIERASERFRDYYESWANCGSVSDPSLRSLLALARHDRAQRRRLKRINSLLVNSIEENDSLDDSADCATEGDESILKDDVHSNEYDQAFKYIQYQMRVLFSTLLRSRRLNALLESEVIFGGTGSPRSLEMTRGQLKMTSDLQFRTQDPLFRSWIESRLLSETSESGGGVEQSLLVALDSASVLLGEVNRHVTKGGWIQVTERPNHLTCQGQKLREWSTVGFLNVLRPPQNKPLANGVIVE